MKCCTCCWCGSGVSRCDSSFPLTSGERYIKQFVHGAGRPAGDLEGSRRNLPPILVPPVVPNQNDLINPLTTPCRGRSTCVRSDVQLMFGEAPHSVPPPSAEVLLLPLRCHPPPSTPPPHHHSFLLRSLSLCLPPFASQALHHS